MYMKHGGAGASKSHLHAAVISTLERLLASMSAHVCLKVRTLHVAFATASH